MKKVKIIRNGNQYLQGFEPNEQYARQARGIQTGLHNSSEFDSVWNETPKGFDPITAKGYLAMLCDEMRWKSCNQTITLTFYEE